VQQVGPRACARHSVVDDGSQINDAAVERCGIGFDLRRLEQSFHHPVQLASFRHDDVERPCPRLRHVAERSVGQHRHVARQHGERRSELMGRHVQERALRLAGGIGGDIEASHLLLALTRGHNETSTNEVSATQTLKTCSVIIF